MDLDDLKRWIGRTETLQDHVTLAPLQALAATLDRGDALPRPGDPVPPGCHWLYFLPLPRRMWAGSRMEFRHALQTGAPVTRTSTIADVSAKQGRTGPLVFVRVQHEIADARGVAIAEDQDIVYREMPQAGEVPPAAPDAGTDAQFSRRITPDPVLLFRYSALVRTFEFKAVSPLFDTAPFDACGRVDADVASLWARGPQGQLAMQATATLSTL